METNVKISWLNNCSFEIIENKTMIWMNNCSPEIIENGGQSQCQNDLDE